MALTEEQIKNLKPYDTLILNNYPISYLGTYTSGIIGALDDKAEACCYTRCHFPQQYLSLPPKHDPCRLFKEGDIVKRRTVDGRTDIDVAEGINLTVTRGESIHGNIVVKEPNGRSIVTKSVFLELVTPVEELEPYEVKEFKETIQVRVRNTPVMLASFDKECHPNAKAAAEAERDRLNAEYRKERENG